jgi:hypothetical protein
MFREVGGGGERELIQTDMGDFEAETKMRSISQLHESSGW